MENLEGTKTDRLDKQAADLGALMEELCAARDRTVPGSPEEDKAARALLDAIISGGRSHGY
jgi:hypothetical protein